MKICPKCKKENTDDRFWCKHCNSPLIEKAETDFKPKIQTPELSKNKEEKQQKQEIPIEEIPEEIPPDIKKKITHIVIPIIIITIIAVAAIIYLQAKNPYVDENEQFFGKWIEQTEGNDYIFFYSNDNNCDYYKNSILYQGNFKLKDGDPSKNEPNTQLLSLYLTDNSGGKLYNEYKYTYSFGTTTEETQTLILTNIDTSHGIEKVTFIKSK